MKLWRVFHQVSWTVNVVCYLQSGKFDMAGDLLKKCLQYNKVMDAWILIGTLYFCSKVGVTVIRIHFVCSL